MPMDIESYLGVHTAALKLREQRTELLANNLANADTPGFKARDLDFRSALEAATSPGNAPGTLRRTDHGTTLATGGSTAGATGAATGGTDAFLKYRTPLAPSLDGNTVDTQLEQAAFAENAVRYQATLTFLNSKFRGLMSAITGQ